MFRYKIAVTVALLTLLIAAAPASAELIVVAHGDKLDIDGSIAPAGTTSGKLWLFGNKDMLGPIDIRVDSGGYHTSISKADVYRLDLGSYTAYLQFPGNNDLYDVTIDGTMLRTIYKAVPDISIQGLSGGVARDKFTALMATAPIDDVLQKESVSVQEPSIILTNMYTNHAGDLYIVASTNLAPGDKITAMIDEETYKTPEYLDKFGYSTVVSKDRKINLMFNHTAAAELQPGKHFVYVHYLESGVMTIPFHRYTDFIAPTPTPVVNYYYSVTGELLGIDVNTTNPEGPKTPTPTPTPVQTYKTVLAAIHINNRTIEQHDEIYVGEKNLDVWGTLGWMSSDGYYWIQYCDGDGEKVRINNPYHFNVDNATFGGKYGAWCQYSDDIDENDPPVAFIIASPYGMNLTDILGPTPVPTKTPTPRPTPVKTTPPTTVPTTPPTPEPTPTIQVPLPWWIAVVAVAGVIVWKKQN